jgi:hypothetical protein
MYKNSEALPLLPDESRPSFRPLTPIARALKVAAAIAFCVVALLLFGPLWVIEGVRRGLGKRY